MANIEYLLWLEHMATHFMGIILFSPHNVKGNYYYLHFVNELEP